MNKPTTVLDQCREVEALLGCECSIHAGLQYATITPITDPAREVALFGQNQPNWRNRNKRLIKEMKNAAAAEPEPATV